MKDGVLHGDTLLTDQFRARRVDFCVESAPVVAMLGGMTHTTSVFFQTPLQVWRLARIVISFLTKENVDDELHFRDKGS